VVSIYRHGILSVGIRCDCRPLTASLATVVARRASRQQPVTIFTPGFAAAAAKVGDHAFVTVIPEAVVRATGSVVHPKAPARAISDRPSPSKSPDNADGTAPATD
jgi:hypothetical protein